MRVSINYGVCYVCGLIAFGAVLFPFVAVAEEPLSQLSDEQLLRVMWRDEAKAEFNRRLGTYPQSKRDELRRLLESRVIPVSSAASTSTEQLIDISATYPGSSSVFEIADELKDRYERGSAEDRTRLKQLYVARGERLPLPVRGDVSEKATRQRAAYLGFGHLAVDIFPEADALDILERLFLDGGVDAGVRDFIYCVQQWRNGSPGALVAKRLEGIHQSLDQYPENMLLEEPAALRWQISIALGGCGEAGLEVLETIGWDSDPGIAAVGTIGTPRARDLLMNRYQELDPSATWVRLPVLRALSGRLYRSDETVKAFVRRELPQYLILPDSDPDARTVSQAVVVAGKTCDPYFLTALQDLLSRIEAAGFVDQPEPTPYSASMIAAEAKEAAECLMRIADKLRHEAATPPKE